MPHKRPRSWSRGLFATNTGHHEANSGLAIVGDSGKGEGIRVAGVARRGSRARRRDPQPGRYVLSSIARCAILRLVGWSVPMIVLPMEGIE